MHVPVTEKFLGDIRRTSVCADLAGTRVLGLELVA